MMAEGWVCAHCGFACCNEHKVAGLCKPSGKIARHKCRPVVLCLDSAVAQASRRVRV